MSKGNLFRCIWLCKDTNLKANHNSIEVLRFFVQGVYDSAKILIWKQITTGFPLSLYCHRCIWLCKDTNLKANHNYRLWLFLNYHGVYDSAKILIWKQITTVVLWFADFNGCIWLCKDTNLKANHNILPRILNKTIGVYDSAKILIWKQITTSKVYRWTRRMVYMTLQRY